jgi:hypothetical protein
MITSKDVTIVEGRKKFCAIDKLGVQMLGLTKLVRG